MADQTAGGRKLADKLDHLFRSVHPRGRGEYTYAEVAKAIEDRGGPTVSATYIWQLRKGRRDNPTKRHLEALADFFGVRPAYFFDDAEAERTDARLRELEGLPEPAREQHAPGDDDAGAGR